MLKTSSEGLRSTSEIQHFIQLHSKLQSSVCRHLKSMEVGKLSISLHVIWHKILLSKANALAGLVCESQAAWVWLRESGVYWKWPKELGVAAWVAGPPLLVFLWPFWWRGVFCAESAPQLSRAGHSSRGWDFLWAVWTSTNHIHGYWCGLTERV